MAAASIMRSLPDDKMTDLLQHIDDQPLRTDVENLIHTVPESNAVITRLISFFVSKSGAKDEQLTSAKRSWDESLEAEIVRTNPDYKLTEISFTAPERKKMDLHVGERHLFIVHYKSKFELNVAIADLDTLVCVPTPEKAKPVYTFVLFYKNSFSNAIVFSLPSDSRIEFYDMNENQFKASRSVGVDELCDFFKDNIKIPHILRPSPEDFVSIKLTPTGQRQINYGVKAYRKTSEGYLYFLSDGIFYGFKRPTLFFRLSELVATSFHDITQRTFNLTLTMAPGKSPLGIGYDSWAKKNKDTAEEKGPVEGERFEFSMIDQTEYGLIDTYIKKHKINDNSMSEERKAPPPKIQREGKDDDEEEEDGVAGQAKQRQHDDDDDDEEDVNFQPSDNSEDDDLEYDSQASDHEEDHGSDGGDDEVSGDDEAVAEASGEEGANENAMDEDEEDELDE
ncbi:hypothetical protein Unana1_08220 [Umbelopsis nana]